MTQILQNFPALWVLVGALVAGVIFLIANWKVFAMQRTATENLIGLYKEQVAALEKEREMYRDNLQTERTAHQECQLQLKELEARPDLTTVQDVMRTVADSLNKVANKLDGRDAVFQRIEKGFQRTADGLEEVLRLLKAEHGHA